MYYRKYFRNRLIVDSDNQSAIVSDQPRILKSISIIDGSLSFSRSKNPEILPNIRNVIGMCLRCHWLYITDVVNIINVTDFEKSTNSGISRFNKKFFHCSYGRQGTGTCSKLKFCDWSINNDSILIAPKQLQ